jgi:hypothetical protein
MPSAAHARAICGIWSAERGASVPPVLLLPTLRDMSALVVLLYEDAPSPRNPLGIKGGGESGITA